MTVKIGEPEGPLPWGTKRGDVVQDRNGGLWRRSNGPNIYPINRRGSRVRRNGELIYLRIAYALKDPTLAPFERVPSSEAEGK